MKKSVWEHFDFRFYGVILPAIICFLAIIPCVMLLPQNFGYENGLLENIQMLILLFCFIAALRAKTNKKFFIFLALVITILMLREINCGRTIFFPVPGEENNFYSWKDIKYGYLAHPLYGLYMISVAFYFIKNKLYLVLWNLLTKIKLPVYNILFLGIGFVLSMYAEKHTHNFVFEEMAELLMYASLAGIIYLYAHNNYFKIEEE
jgi:hypothetical protein